mgnify:CR=1 FL=1
MEKDVGEAAAGCFPAEVDDVFVSGFGELFQFIRYLVPVDVEEGDGVDGELVGSCGLGRVEDRDLDSVDDVGEDVVGEAAAEIDFAVGVYDVEVVGEISFVEDSPFSVFVVDFDAVLFVFGFFDVVVED